MLTGKKEFSREAVVKTRKTNMRNIRNKTMMCPLREQVEKEEPSGGNDGNMEEVMEKEDEELGSYSFEPHQPRLVINNQSTFCHIKDTMWLLSN